MRDAVIYLAIVLPLAALTGFLARRHDRSFWIYFVFCALVPVGSLVGIPYLLGTGHATAEVLTLSYEFVETHPSAAGD
jgi:hypothetical protein